MTLSTVARTDVNRSAILAQIGTRGPLSRASLARVLAVSPALITQLTRELIADGLLRELAHSPSEGGRPARLLGLVAGAGRSIGVKLASDHCTLVEVEIDGTVIRSATEPFDAAAPTAVGALSQMLTVFVGGSDDSRILGVGIGVPGTVDRQGEGTVTSSQLGWAQVPLGSTLRRDLSLPVLVENNVNALTMAETLYGQGRGLSNFLVVTIGTGVGAGIVIDGAISRGSSGSSGEIGHIPVQDGGPLCQCGNHGCLEAIVGEGALVRQAREQYLIANGAGIDDLRGRADGGDAASKEIFERAGHTLGRVLAGVVHTVDPEIVILLGEGTAAWSHWSHGFEAAFRSSLMPHLRGVALAVESWQDDSWAQGAASLVLATSFDSEGVSGEQGRLVRQRLFEHTGTIAS